MSIHPVLTRLIKAHADFTGMPALEIPEGIPMSWVFSMMKSEIDEEINSEFFQDSLAVPVFLLAQRKLKEETNNLSSAELDQFFEKIANPTTMDEFFTNGRDMPYSEAFEYFAYSSKEFLVAGAFTDSFVGLTENDVSLFSFAPDYFFDERFEEAGFSRLLDLACSAVEIMGAADLSETSPMAIQIAKVLDPFLTLAEDMIDLNAGVEYTCAS